MLERGDAAWVRDLIARTQYLVLLQGIHFCASIFLTHWGFVDRNLDSRRVFGNGHPTNAVVTVTRTWIWVGDHDRQASQ
jgi:hypothetical protein